MSAVVSDTSPVRALAHLGLIDLLRTIYGQVLLPPAVHHELTNPPARYAVVDVGPFPFIGVQSPRDQSAVQHFLQTFQRGESEAIALALEVQAKSLLIDEAKGRRIAKQVGLQPTGVLAVLVEGKQQGVVPAVGPLLDRLMNELNFFIAPSLRATVLLLAGEALTP
ncbi:MAG TPA: DUF3368 domain-containing protein [Gemmataceae bacterium]|nr:DUF3368 domain-containing protein [Gemmataceae bacterium]